MGKRAPAIEILNKKEFDKKKIVKKPDNKCI